MLYFVFLVPKWGCCTQVVDVFSSQGDAEKAIRKLLTVYKLLKQEHFKIKEVNVWATKSNL